MPELFIHTILGIFLVTLSGFVIGRMREPWGWMPTQQKAIAAGVVLVWLLGIYMVVWAW